jgi:lipopolysaccharide export system protein LptC
MTHLTAAQNGVTAARTYWTVNRGDSARAFRAARRHSRLVRFLRVAIPVVAVLAVLVVAAITYFNPANVFGKLPLDVGNLVVSGTKITMEQPHLTGFTRDARAYDLTAEAAAQDITKPNIVELKGIRGKMEMQDKSTVNVTAAAGVYDSKAEKLKLERDILLTTSSGYEGRLHEALIDIHSGDVVSEQPVKLNLLQGTLDAKRLEITKSGTVIRFSDGVHMILQPEASASAPAAEPGAPKP